MKLTTAISLPIYEYRYLTDIFVEVQVSYDHENSQTSFSGG